MIDNGVFLEEAADLPIELESALLDQAHTPTSFLNLDLNVVMRPEIRNHSQCERPPHCLQSLVQAFTAARDGGSAHSIMCS